MISNKSRILAGLLMFVVAVLIFAEDATLLMSWVTIIWALPPKSTLKLTKS